MAEGQANSRAGPGENAAAPLLGVSSTRAAAFTAALYYGTAFLMIVWAKAMLGEVSVAGILGFAAPMAIVDGLLAFSLFILLRQTRAIATGRRVLILIAGLCVVSALQSTWDTLLHIWSGKLLNYYNSPYDAFIRATTVNFYQSGMLLALLGFQSAYLEVRQQKQDLIAASRRERTAQMLALRFQLNPHFLFNSMNSISSLVVVGRNSDAEHMIHQLSDFLRASLSADPTKLNRLDEEFDMLESYLEIEHIRFEERLEVAIDLPPGLRDLCIPAFLLQPLIENAIKYAVAPSNRSVTISIKAEVAGESLRLIVADDGDVKSGVVGSGTGLGLANVRERLALQYQGAAKLALERLSPGFRAEITLPLHLAINECEKPAAASLAA